MITVSSVSVSVGKQPPLLSDISFTVPAGELCAIVGVNGIGKSTLLRALAGIEKPTSGSVHVAGKNIHQLKARQRATQLAFVGQEELLPPDLTLLEAVSMGRTPHLKPWQLAGEKAAEIATDKLREVGLEPFAYRRCTQLSGGQRRLALLARAFAQGSDVLMLDEPTNHLDVRHQITLLETLRGSEHTVLATMHDLDLAMTHFDRVVVLHEGGVLACGAPVDVLEPRRVRTAFDVESIVARVGHRKRPHIVFEPSSERNE